MFSFNQFSQSGPFWTWLFEVCGGFWWRFRPQDKTTLGAVDFRAFHVASTAGCHHDKDCWMLWSCHWCLVVLATHARKAPVDGIQECYDNDRWVQLRVPEFRIYTSSSFWYGRMMKNVHHVSRFRCLEAFECCCRCSIGVTQLLSAERESSPISCDFWFFSCARARTLQVQVMLKGICRLLDQRLFSHTWAAS